MFRLFKKKQKTTHDKLVELLYGEGEHAQACDLSIAVDLAETELLQGIIRRADIEDIASKLKGGAMPYSTEDLALSVALNFFRRPELKPKLFTAQLKARMIALEWHNAGKANPMLVRSFEHVLYNDYKRGG